MTERGSGQTSKQIEEAPDGAFFVVHTIPMLRHAEELVEQLRPGSNIKPVASWYAARTFEGTDRRVVIDHAAVDKIDDVLRAKITQHNLRVSV